MPSQLINNEGISFLAAKNFTYAGEEFEMGDDFPQEKARNIEVLVRSRFVIPVLEDGALKPRHWHTHVRTREAAHEYLFRERTQLVWPTEADEAVDLNVLTNPELTPEPEGEGGDVYADIPEGADNTASDPDLEPEDPNEPVMDPSDESEPEPPESLEETYDPAEHNVTAVLEYMEEHPEQREDILAMERANRGRKGILGDD